MMFTAVGGSIAQHTLLGEHGSDLGGVPSDGAAPLLGSGSALQDLAKALKMSDSPPPAGQPDSLTIESGTLLVRTLHRGAYESRVLQGIWAAAPYLHNGSVPTLAELLKPAAQRTSKFSLGAKYDIENVGLAATQDGSNARPVTDCSDLNSGNSKCGHEFGTNLSDGDKKALLEFLKTL
jgi:hypothetical protein